MIYKIKFNFDFYGHLWHNKEKVLESFMTYNSFK